MYLVSPIQPRSEQPARIAAAAAVVTGYARTYAIAGPPFGVLANSFAPRRAIITGAVVFLVGDLACAVALNPHVLATSAT